MYHVPINDRRDHPPGAQYVMKNVYIEDGAVSVEMQPDERVGLYIVGYGFFATPHLPFVIGGYTFTRTPKVFYC